MIKPIITAEEAVQMVQSGDTLVIGGSGAGHAIPEKLIEALGRAIPVNTSAARPNRCSHQRHGRSRRTGLGPPRRSTPD